MCSALSYSYRCVMFQAHVLHHVHYSIAQVCAERPKLKWGRSGTCHTTPCISHPDVYETSNTVLGHSARAEASKVAKSDQVQAYAFYR